MDSPAAPLGVTVVGAGLAGSLTALYLARAGHRVEVFERRPDPRRDAGDGGRSINLGLSARGMAALREVGLLDQLLPTAVPMRGRVVHARDGSLSFHPYGTAEHEVLHSVLRRDLNTLLINAAQAHDNVRFHFDTKLTALDADGGITWLVDERTGVETSAKADLVVGADGAFSLVRQHLLHGSRADFQQEFMDWGYKELTIPVGQDGRPRTELHALHVWPGERALIVAHPNHDGSLTCTLFLPFDGEPSFASLTTPDAVRAFFDQQFPDTAALMPDLVDEFTAHPVGNLVTVRTSRWHHDDKVVLVGDASHAVYPFYGQGMNAAFEDCSVLAASLRRHPADRAAALAEYAANRRPNTDVLADLAKQNFIELRDGMRSPAVLVRKKVDLLLNRMFPRSWSPLYTMVSHTTMPYAQALHRSRRQDATLRLAAGAIGAAAGLTALAGLGRLTGRAGRGRRTGHVGARGSAR